MTAHYFWTLVTFAIVMGGAYHLIGRKIRTRQGVALAIGFVAAWPLLEGGSALEEEMARRERGRVDPGVVLTKLSSTGEDGSRTIGRSYRRFGPGPFVNTADGFRVHDVLTRLLLTGSPQAWVIDYRYSCGASAGCTGRDFVPRELWSRLQPGQPVNIRSVKGRPASGRLSENGGLSTPGVKFAMGGLLAVVAVLVHNFTPRQKYVIVPAVVTAVNSVPSGESLHWRVRFAYFDESGQAREGADEVFKPGLKPGDDCLVRYPQGHPALGTLDASTAAAIP